MPVLVALIEAMCDPAIRRRAQRQHAGRRHADHPERPDHQGARLQLHAGRAARRLSGQHVGRPLLAAVPAQRRRLPAAQDRQGDVRQHLARRARGERGRAERDRLADRTASTWVSRPATTPSRSRATPAAARCHRSSGSTPEEMLPYLADSVRAIQQLADHVHHQPRARHAAAARGDHADHRRDDRESRLEKGRRQDVAVRARAHSRARVRAPAARLEHPRRVGS